MGSCRGSSAAGSSGRGAAWISALAWGARGHRFKSGRPDLPFAADSRRICIGCCRLRRLSRCFFFLYHAAALPRFSADIPPRTLLLAGYQLRASLTSACQRTWSLTSLDYMLRQVLRQTTRGGLPNRAECPLIPRPDSRFACSPKDIGILLDLL